MEANVFCNFWPNLCLSWCVCILHQQLYSNLTYSLCFTIFLLALQRVIGQMLFPLPVWFESLFSSTALIAPLPTWAPLTHTPLPEPDLEILEIQEYWHKTFNVCIASICVFILRCECDGGQGWYDTIESGSHLSLLTLFVGATIETYTS